MSRGPIPDAHGRFGAYGGRFVPETLMPALDELEAAWREAREAPAFRNELAELLSRYAGRETPLGEARRMTEDLGGAKILLKREDLCHTGAHKINNTLGQVLLARRMGKRRIIAETGAGQHGVATATACALFGLPCVVYMGAEDVRRQALNVVRMRLLGAEVVPVKAGARTLKDAMNEAIRDWVTRVRDTHYVIGSVAGPHPYPALVRDFQAVIGREARAQCVAYEGRLPDAVVACVGGGSNAMGIFSGFVDDPSVQLVAVEAAGHGTETGLHGASLALGSPGVLHGSRSYVLQDDDGQIAEAHSISAGLDYPGVGPELAYLRDEGRLTLAQVTDAEAIDAFRYLARTEGILPALESAHAIAHARRLARELGRGALVVVNLSGRGDKDVAQLEPLVDLVASETGHSRSPVTARPATGKRSMAACVELPASPRLPVHGDAGDGRRLAATFARCRSEGRAALVAYVMAGDPDLAGSEAIALACLEGGADILELGIPFSDPIADGPILQRAAARALASGTTVASCLGLAARLRAQTAAPLALMTYSNPVLAMGEADFVRGCRDAGVDALLFPDAPPEEAASLAERAAEAGIKWASFVSPVSSPARIDAALTSATGFVYLVSVTGVTGKRRELPAELPTRVRELQRASAVPVVVGFGVSHPSHVRALGPFADGIVVGSAIVSRAGGRAPLPERVRRVTRYVRALRRALDGGSAYSATQLR